MAAYKRTSSYDLPPLIWNLYVVRLDDDAKKYNHRPPTNDNNGKNTGQCVYVGVTTKEPEDRLKEHKTDSRGNKNVSRIYYEFLMPSYYEYLNIGWERGKETYEQASRRERELAKKLESRGHIVWCYTK